MISFDGTHLVLAKPLSGGDVAVALFNEGASPAVISTTATAVGLPHAPAYTLQDLWTQRTTETAGAIEQYVQPDQTVVYRVSTGHHWNAFAPQVLLAPTASSGQLAPGQPTTIHVTATNDGASAANQLQFGLTVPNGWKSSETTPPAPGALPPGASKTAAWTLTPDAAAHRSAPPP